MTYQEKIESFQKELFKLEPFALLAFGVLLCYRLLPNYKYFNKSSGFGNVDELEKAINFAIELIDSELEFDENQFAYFVELVENNTPDTEHYDSIFVSFALDSCIAIIETLEFVKNKDVNHILAVSTSSTDTVHAFVQEKFEIEYNDPDYESKILNNSLIKEELAYQVNLIRHLMQGNWQKDSVLNLLKEIKIDKSNIDF